MDNIVHVALETFVIAAVIPFGVSMGVFLSALLKFWASHLLG